MDYASARHLAMTGVLFIPAETRTTNKAPDARAIHREMVKALQADPATIPVPQVVVAPGNLFDQAWNAIVNGIWDEHLKTAYHCMRRAGVIEFVPKT